MSEFIQIYAWYFAGQAGLVTQEQEKKELEKEYEMVIVYHKTKLRP